MTNDLRPNQGQWRFQQP